MYIKITEENLDYNNKARKKYNSFPYNCPIDITRKFIHVTKLTYYIDSGLNIISFEKFKKLNPLKEINKPIELW